MQPKFTRNILWTLQLRMLSIAFLLFIGSRVSSQVLINENFDTGIPAGWTEQNNSVPLGAGPWFQGNPNAFSANSGAPDSYLAVNYESVDDLGTISNWMILPNITLKNGDIFTFFSRVPTGGGVFPDRMQVRLSTNGASTNVGATETSVGDFTNLLLDINPLYSTTEYPEVWTQFVITISGLPGPTSGRLAFRYLVENAGFSGSNSNYVGIDDVVYTTFSSACSGTPDPGDAISSVATVCPTVSFHLSLENPPTESGYTFQWQSATALAGPYTDIPGATFYTLDIAQTEVSFYRCNVTCTNSTLSATSTPVEVQLSPSSECYCIPSGDDCTLDDAILEVNIGDLSNASGGCTAGGYANFPAATATTDLVQGGSYPMSVTIGPGGFDFIGAWIDYNHSGTFETSEFTDITGLTGPIGVGTATRNVVVPANALTGPTRMRIRVAFFFQFTGAEPCDLTGYGETEDYTVNIIPCLQGAITLQPSNASTECGSSASFTVATTGSLITYQWEQRVNSSSPWTNVIDGPVFSGATEATLNLTNVPDTYNNYQYRVLISGACTATDFSTIALLSVTPLVATVDPSSATICSGDIVALKLTNAAAPNTVTFTNNTSTDIPDADPTGMTSTINVSGIPSGVVVSNISVSFNITHTWVGDLDINLVGPNGQVINLVGGLDNGTGSNGSDDFVNTTISSTSTNQISGAAAPRTGTYAAEGRDGYGPSDYIQTTANWADLADLLNGDWKLAIADYGFGDFGPLTSWSISITYGAEASGVWSPIESLFSDALATVPYTGDPVNTVYAKPDVSTEYSVVYSSPTCTSEPTTIAVSVSTLPAGITDPVDVDGCVNGSASFTAAAASGGPISYQWQVSTDGGTNYDDIGGATSATLELSGITSSMNNNLYRVVMSAEPCGSVTSAAGKLIVHDLPVVTLSSPTIFLTPGSSTTITASSNPGPLNANSFNWTLNGASVPGVTTSTVNAGIDQIGVYSATVTDVNGCVNYSDDFEIGALSSDRVWIYPNPTTTGQFQVRLFNDGTPSEKRTVEIFNAQGVIIIKKVFTIENNSNPYLRMEFDLSKYPTGVYVVKIVDNYANKKYSGLVVVAR